MDQVTRTLLALSALLAAVLVSGAAWTQSADRWTLDREHSEIRFSWDHLGLSRKSGRFLDFDVKLEFSPTDPVSGTVEATIKVVSLATGVRALDDALRSPDFFNSAQHPTITFKSTGITKTGERTGDITGDLTMLGVTRPITLATRWNFTGEHPLASANPVFQGKWVSGFSASAKLDRSAFGLKRGTPLISDEVEIVIEVEFLRAP
jgi:polyisoprenoid-binding protein YceI